jgi:preprotein translocase subunit SecG
MQLLISIIIIVACILLILVVYIQNPKGGGLSSDFGAAQQIGGVQRTNDFIDKATWTLAGIIMVLSVVMTIMLTPERQLTPEEIQQQQQQEQQKGGSSGQKGGTPGNTQPGKGGK